jgi:hypothetical protein
MDWVGQMVKEAAIKMWQNKLSEAVLCIAGGLTYGKNINPNSQIYQDSYRKGLYALSIVAEEIDRMFPEPINYQFEEDA